MAMAAKPQSTSDLNIFTSEHPLVLFLLAYRWAGLLLAMGLFLVSDSVVVSNVSPTTLIAISLGSTLVVTLLNAPVERNLLATPTFLGIDLILAVFLVTVSGATHSPYYLYALSPLLAGAFFFQVRGAIIMAAAFSVLYPAIIIVMQQMYAAITVDLGLLFTQMVGAWLVTILFGSLSAILNQLRHAHSSLTSAHQNLTQQNAELETTYRQLEVIHELTLFLHAPDSQSVKQRLLNVVTKEFDIDKAVVALVNPALRRLDGWQAYPPDSIRVSSAHPLGLDDEEGPLIDVVLNQQVVWCSPGNPLSTDANLNAWLGSDNWLLMPMIWQEQTVGVLLVVVDNVEPIDMLDDRWPVLTSLVSQAAVALGTIDRTRKLAVEQERNRIARDIHDTVAQSLFGIVFTLDACAKLLPNQVDMVKQELVEIRNVADTVRQQVRQSIMDIWPSILTQEQFKLDLEKYVKHCAPSQMFHVDFTFDGDFDGLPPIIRRSLYRVCQESLANAAKHANTDLARVYLYVESDEIYMSVRDRGIGFDPKPVLARERNRERFGLRGMQERIETLGGDCDILSQVGHGTQVLVRLPINGKNGHAN